MEYKKCGLVMLPAKEFRSSALVLGVKVDGYKLPVASLTKDVVNDSGWLNHGTPQHLYVTSEKELICDGDWYYIGLFSAIEKLVKTDIVDDFVIEVLNNNKYNRKIIATTDQTLTKNMAKGFNNIPWIPLSFISKFVENYNNGRELTQLLVGYENKYSFKPTVNSGSNTIIARIPKNNWNRKEMEEILIKCCGEISCEDGTLVGKHPADLFKWIEETFRK